ncbi:MAG: glycosyltransferase family 2 protein [Candidatus Levybacteria bacterium]|nr:glycosyltransferase family 2 protein [Candidatus Levybacteria bacterium]
MNAADLSIVIVSYNAKDFLRRCLTSIQKNPANISHEVIVVDNASPDDSADMVEKEFPKVHLIAHKENVGFSKANNIGIKKSSGRYVLFLNPDTEIVDNALEEMIDFMDAHEEAGAATCFVKMPNGKLDDAAHRGFPTPWNAFCHFSGLGKVFPKSMLFNGYHMGWKDLDRVHEIEVLAGAFMIVRREAGEQVGWWDEDYFFYGEDVDFCYVLWEKGWKIFFVPGVTVLHNKGVSGGIRKESESVTTADIKTRRRVTKARFDAMKIFYNKHYVQKYPKLVTWIMLSMIDVKYRFTLKKL